MVADGGEQPPSPILCIDGRACVYVGVAIRVVICTRVNAYSQPRSRRTWGKKFETGSGENIKST